MAESYPPHCLGCCLPHFVTARVSPLAATHVSAHHLVCRVQDWGCLHGCGDDDVCALCGNQLLLLLLLRVMAKIHRRRRVLCGYGPGACVRWLWAWRVS
jgi:hypothetical protein